MTDHNREIDAPNEPEVKTVAGYRLLYVMATLAEYQGELQKRIKPLISQVGPVESALNVSRHLAQKGPVDLVVSLGSAGSARLQQAQIYQVSHVSYRDMDASAFGFPRGETPFLDLPGQIELGLTVPGLDQASISTGANVVSGEAYQTIEADMVDMETWAIMRACHVANVPMIGLRGISDGAHPVAEYSDWTRYLDVIDARLALAVDKLENAITKNAVTIDGWKPPAPKQTGIVG